MKVKKSAFPGFSGAAWDALFAYFGSSIIFDTLQKSEKGPAQGVRKFANNGYNATPNESSDLLRENKEVYNGETYLNQAPGDIQIIQEQEYATKKIGINVDIKKMDAPKRIVIGEVYVPYDPEDPSTVDSHGHACSAEEIEKAAYGFMEELRNNDIDHQHNFISGYGVVVESYIAKENDPMFKEGSWILGVKVKDETVWSKIEKGEITGFSLAGEARLNPVK